MSDRKSGLRRKQQHAGVLRHRGGDREARSRSDPTAATKPRGRGTLDQIPEHLTWSNCVLMECLFHWVEQDDEPLSPPPILSITEEILEFINQSRAREGLTALHDTTVRTPGGPSSGDHRRSSRIVGISSVDQFDQLT